MQARCPHCKRVFATEQPGIQPCPECGKQINVPGPPSAEAGFTAPGSGDQSPRCARHVDRSAPSTSARCGNFMCDECSLSGQSPTCPACRELAGSSAREPTPWERRAEIGIVQG